MPDAPDDSKRVVAAAFGRLWFESTPEDEKAELQEALAPEVKAMDLASALDTIRASDTNKLVKLRAVASSLKRRPSLFDDLPERFVAVVQSAKPDANVDQIRQGLDAFRRRGGTGRLPDPAPSDQPKQP